MVFTYTDDWLVVTKSRVMTIEHTTTTVSLLRSLGWIVNHKKLIPCQGVTYLGGLYWT